MLPGSGPRPAIFTKISFKCHNRAPGKEEELNWFSPSQDHGGPTSFFLIPWVMESHWRPLDLCCQGVTLVETGRRDWSGNITGDRKAHRHLWIYHCVRFGYKKQTTEKAKIIVA